METSALTALESVSSMLDSAIVDLDMDDIDGQEEYFDDENTELYDETEELIEDEVEELREEYVGDGTIFIGDNEFFSDDEDEETSNEPISIESELSNAREDIESSYRVVKSLTDEERRDILRDPLIERQMGYELVEKPMLWLMDKNGRISESMHSIIAANINRSGNPDLREITPADVYQVAGGGNLGRDVNSAIKEELLLYATVKAMDYINDHYTNVYANQLDQRARSKKDYSLFELLRELTDAERSIVEQYGSTEREKVSKALALLAARSVKTMDNYHSRMKSMGNAIYYDHISEIDFQLRALRALSDVLTGSFSFRRLIKDKGISVKLSERDERLEDIIERLEDLTSEYTAKLRNLKKRFDRSPDREREWVGVTEYENERVQIEEEYETALNTEKLRLAEMMAVCTDVRDQIIFLIDAKRIKIREQKKIAALTLQRKRNELLREYQRSGDLAVLSMDPISLESHSIIYGDDGSQTKIPIERARYSTLYSEHIIDDVLSRIDISTLDRQILRNNPELDLGHSILTGATSLQKTGKEEVVAKGRGAKVRKKILYQENGVKIPEVSSRRRGKYLGVEVGDTIIRRGNMNVPADFMLGIPDNIQKLRASYGLDKPGLIDKGRALRRRITEDRRAVKAGEYPSALLTLIDENNLSVKDLMKGRRQLALRLRKIKGINFNTMPSTLSSRKVYDTTIYYGNRVRMQSYGGVMTPYRTGRKTIKVGLDIPSRISRRGGALNDRPSRPVKTMVVKRQTRSKDMLLIQSIRGLLDHNEIKKACRKFFTGAGPCVSTTYLTSQIEKATRDILGEDFALIKAIDCTVPDNLDIPADRVYAKFDNGRKVITRRWVLTSSYPGEPVFIQNATSPGPTPEQEAKWTESSESVRKILRKEPTCIILSNSDEGIATTGWKYFVDTCEYRDVIINAITPEEFLEHFWKGLAGYLKTLENDEALRRATKITTFLSSQLGFISHSDVIESALRSDNMNGLFDILSNSRPEDLYIIHNQGIRRNEITKYTSECLKALMIDDLIVDHEMDQNQAVYARPIMRGDINMLTDKQIDLIGELKALQIEKALLTRMRSFDSPSSMDSLVKSSSDGVMGVAGLIEKLDLNYASFVARYKELTGISEQQVEENIMSECAKIAKSYRNHLRAAWQHIHRVTELINPLIGSVESTDYPQLADNFHNAIDKRLRSIIERIGAINAQMQEQKSIREQEQVMALNEYYEELCAYLINKIVKEAPRALRIAARVVDERTDVNEQPELISWRLISECMGVMNDKEEVIDKIRDLVIETFASEAQDGYEEDLLIEKGYITVSKSLRRLQKRLVAIDNQHDTRGVIIRSLTGESTLPNVSIFGKDKNSENSYFLIDMDLVGDPLKEEVLERYNRMDLGLILATMRYLESKESQLEILISSIGRIDGAATLGAIVSEYRGITGDDYRKELALRERLVRLIPTARYAYKRIVNRLNKASKSLWIKQYKECEEQIQHNIESSLGIRRSSVWVPKVNTRLYYKTN